MPSPTQNTRPWLVAVAVATTVLIACSDSDVHVNANGNPVPIVPNPDFWATAPFAVEVDAGNRTGLRLLGINGAVTVTGVAGADKVTVAATKRVGSDSLEDAEAQLSNLTVDVQTLPNELFVQTLQPQIVAGRSYVVDYDIAVPRFFQIQLDSINGTLNVASMDNDVSVKQVNGNITLAGILGSAGASVVNGRIDGDVTLPLNGKIDFNTVNGGVTLTIPANTSAEFHAAVNTGNISTTNLLLENENRTPSSLSGTLGSGQGHIDLEAKVTGNIDVSTR